VNSQHSLPCVSIGLIRLSDVSNLVSLAVSVTQLVLLTIFIHCFISVVISLSPSCPTPNLEDQGIPFCLGHHLFPVWHESHTSIYATASAALSIINAVIFGLILMK